MRSGDVLFLMRSKGVGEDLDITLTNQVAVRPYARGCENGGPHKQLIHLLECLEGNKVEVVDEAAAVVVVDDEGRGSGVEPVPDVVAGEHVLVLHPVCHGLRQRDGARVMGKGC